MGSNTIEKLDLSKLDTSNKYSDYQKLWTESPRQNGEIDQYDSCIFCQEPVSPRKITYVIKKSQLMPRPDQNDPTTYRDMPIPKVAETCCPNCSQRIQAPSIPSPKGFVRRNSSPTCTPRPLKIQREQSWHSSSKSGLYTIPEGKEVNKPRRKSSLRHSRRKESSSPDTSEAEPEPKSSTSEVCDIQ